MTLAGLVKHWRYVEGFKAGRVLEYKVSATGAWKVTTNPSFNEDSEYRFQGERAPEPTYRPFNTNEMEQLVGKKIKKNRQVFFISGYDPEEETVLVGANWINATVLLAEYVNEDGSKCGALATA